MGAGQNDENDYYFLKIGGFFLGKNIEDLGIRSERGRDGPRRECDIGGLHATVVTAERLAAHGRRVAARRRRDRVQDETGRQQTTDRGRARELHQRRRERRRRVQIVLNVRAHQDEIRGTRHRICRDLGRLNILLVAVVATEIALLEGRIDDERRRRSQLAGNHAQIAAMHRWELRPERRPQTTERERLARSGQLLALLRRRHRRRRQQACGVVVHIQVALAGATREETVVKGWIGRIRIRPDRHRRGRLLARGRDASHIDEASERGGLVLCAPPVRRRRRR